MTALAILAITAIFVTIGVVLWLTWRARAGALARGVAASGMRYNDYYGLGAHPDIAPPSSSLPGSRPADQTSLDR